MNAPARCGVGAVKAEAIGTATAATVKAIANAKPMLLNDGANDDDDDDDDDRRTFMLFFVCLFVS